MPRPARATVGSPISADHLPRGGAAEVRQVRDTTGRFALRPHYQPAELDRECEAVLAQFFRPSHGQIPVPIPTDDLTRLIERDVYEAAGGKVTRDLFSADEDGFLDDAALVRRLAIEKLEKKAAHLRPQWAWTKAVLDPEYGLIAQYGRVRPQPAERPPEIAAEIESVEQRLGERGETAQDAWTEELMQEAAQLEERRDQLGETAESLAVYIEKDRARAGCIVTIGDNGDFHLYEGLV